MIKAMRVMQRRQQRIIFTIAVSVIAIAGFLCFRFEGKLIKAPLHYFVEDKVSKALGVTVTMQSIKPGIVGPTVLKGFSVTKASGNDTPFIFKSDKFIIYNNIYQIAIDKLIKKAGFSGINLVFKIENGFLYKGDKPIFQNINGFGKIVNNNLLFDDISGRCYDFPLSVHGKVSGKTSKFDICINIAQTAQPQAARKNTSQLVGDFSKQGELKGSVFFDHVGIGRVDLQSQMDYEVVFLDKNRVSGRIKTSGTVIDYRPFKELEGEFLLEGNVLKIARLELGADYSMSGSVEFNKPYRVDIALKARNGSLGNIDYESMVVNLTGNSPVLKVVDSRILRKKGYIDLSGEVDLTRLWSSQPAQGLKWQCGNEAIVWNGWDIIKEANSKEVQMEKGVGKEKEFMVTFKGYLNDEESWQYSLGHKQDEAVGVEYSLDGAKKIKMQLKNNEEVFSLEHKVKF